MTYDEIEIEDMDWDESLQAFTYQCPCGDLFQITIVRVYPFQPQICTCSHARTLSEQAPQAVRTSPSWMLVAVADKT